MRRTQLFAVILVWGWGLIAALAQQPGATQPGATISPRDQLQQYVAQLQVNPSDDALRTKIIQLALTLDPKPADPPDLPETIGAATYAFKNAQSDTDMQNAASLYAKAALEAPWRADLYFNEAVALEKVKRLDEAVSAYRFYLLAAPNATDGEAVKEEIGALKYQLAQKQQAIPTPSSESITAPRPAPSESPFEGEWRVRSTQHITGGNLYRIRREENGWRIDRLDCDTCSQVNIFVGNQHIEWEQVTPESQKYNATIRYSFDLSQDGQVLAGFLTSHTPPAPPWQVSMVLDKVQ